MNDEQLKSRPLCSCGKHPIVVCIQNNWVCGDCCMKLLKREEEKYKKWIQEIQNEPH